MPIRQEADPIFLEFERSQRLARRLFTHQVSHDRVEVRIERDEVELEGQATSSRGTHLHEERAFFFSFCDVDRRCFFSGPPHQRTKSPLTSEDSIGRGFL